MSEHDAPHVPNALAEPGSHELSVDDVGGEEQRALTKLRQLMRGDAGIRLWRRVDDDDFVGAVDERLRHRVGPGSAEHRSNEFLLLGDDPEPYPFLAALSANIPVLTVIILGCFLFWSLPSMIANTFMPIRSFFAWSFDRLMPEKLADVNDRTHSPVIAIVVVNVIIAALVIWSVTSNVFQLVLGLIVLAGCLGVVIVAAAAIALPSLQLSALHLAVAMAVSSGATSLEAAALVSDGGDPDPGDIAAVRELGPDALVFHAAPDGTILATLRP